MAEAPTRTLTTEERSRARGFLETHFDEDRGCYLSGWSDQRIGKEIDVPWSLVSALREAAYGPIKVDAEVADLTDAIAALEKKLATMEDNALATLEAMRKEINALKTKVEAIGKKRAA